MKAPTGYDFAGWASQNNLRCDDNLIIRRGAFSTQNGKTVPVVYMHNHKDINNVLGHAVLEERDEGIYCYGYLNGTESGRHAKEVLSHGDVGSLSIWANNLVKEGTDVLHGVIREVSLVLAGANPGAFIESVVEHGVPMDQYDDEGILYTGLPIELGSIEHAAKEDDDEDEKEDRKKSEKETDGDEEDNGSKSGKTVGEVMKTLNDDQKLAVAVIVDELTKGKSEDSNKEDEMKHNNFEGNDQEYLAHGIDFSDIMKNAKHGTMKEAVEVALEEGGELMHDGILPSGFPTGSTVDYTNMTSGNGAWRSDIPEGRPTAYGFNDPSLLFPDPHNLNTTPEWISRNMDWVSVVLNGVHRTPFSRIKSQFADITMEEARAKGYTKTHEKKEELFAVLKRVTTPTTIYKKQRLDKDDVTDITDFDVVAWIKSEMRVMLNEEIARAILIGDGRSADSEDKINESNIRPIVNDDPLFNVRVAVNVGATDEDTLQGKKLINTAIRSRKLYKGSGNPIFFTTEDWVTNMLLIEDGIGHKIYKSEAEIATALRVSRIVTVEVLEGATIPVSVTKDGSTTTTNKPLIGVAVNLNDYNVGADKGGAIEMFDDFDIDFNQMVYLIETRMSGALTKPYSALTYYLDQAAAG